MNFRLTRKFQSYERNRERKKQRKQGKQGTSGKLVVCSERCVVAAEQRVKEKEKTEDLISKLS